VDRRDKCKWFFALKVYRVKVNDAYYQQRYEAAAEALGAVIGNSDLMDISFFFVLCAEYVFAHHRQLAALRSRLRQRDREDRAAKRKKERAEQKANAEALKRGLWRPE